MSIEWKETELGKIAFTTSGGTPSRKNENYYSGGTIPWVKSGELEFGTITKTEEFITQAGIDNSSAKIFPKGPSVTSKKTDFPPCNSEIVSKQETKNAIPKSL